MRFSVILPLVDERNSLDHALRAWCIDQTFSADAYEIIAISDAPRPDVDARCNARLRGHDRLLHASGLPVKALTDVAARAARGEYLVFTEAHVVPEPDFLARLDEWHCDNPSYVGALPHVEAICLSLLGTLEYRMFRSQLDEALVGEHWRRLEVHGSSLLRVAYLTHGGFDHAVGEFAPNELAMRLYDAGERIGLAPRAVTRHEYEGDLDGIVGLVTSHAYGEMVWQRRTHPDRKPPYFAPNLAWAERGSFRRVVAARLGWVSIRSLASPAQHRSGLHLGFEAAALWLGRAALGARFDAWITVLLRRRSFTALQRALAESQASVASVEPVFQLWWNRLASASQRRFLAQRYRPKTHTPSASEVLDLAKVRDELLAGFSFVETEQGVAFRRVRPLASVRVALRPGRYRVRVNLLPKGNEQRQVQLYWRGRALSMTFVDSSTCQATLCSPAWRRTGELVLSSNSRPDPVRRRRHHPDVAVVSLAFERLRAQRSRAQPHVEDDPPNAGFAALRRVGHQVLRLISGGMLLGVLRQHEPVPLLTSPPDTRSESTGAASGGPLPAIALVTPSFNQGQFLAQTITSVLTQGYEALQYVVQDGGSTDGSVEIIKDHSDRLTHSESAPDKGQADAINRGFAHTDAEIMGWLNSDDLLLPGSLDCVGAYFADHPDVDVVYGHRVLIDAESREIGRWILPPHRNGVVRWADYIPQETMFWRRALWEQAGGHVDESLLFALDWELVLRFGSVGARMVRLPCFLGAFRVHDDQKTISMMPGVGRDEIVQLRDRTLGYTPSRLAMRWHVGPYLVRSAVYASLYRYGLVRYR